jgi:N-acetylmuramoyl-L-alanine amidase
MQLRRPSAALVAAAAALGTLTACTGAAAQVAVTPAASSAAGAAVVAVVAVASAAATTSATTSRPVGNSALSVAAVGLSGALRTATTISSTTTTTATTTAHTDATAEPKLRLAGLTIVLDPGHNGDNGADPRRLNAPVPAGGFTKPCNTAGTETNAGYPEHAFTWDVATRAAAVLRAEGATVVLTRQSDTGFGPCVNVRAAIGNAAHADAVVAVHGDGAAPGQYGFHVIAPALAPDGGNRAILARSLALAVAMRAQFHSVTGEALSTYVSGGLVRRSDLAGLNLSRVPAIFIECANMRNAGDASRVSSAAWRQKAALGIVAGITAFLHR